MHPRTRNLMRDDYGRLHKQSMKDGLKSELMVHCIRGMLSLTGDSPMAKISCMVS